jgi:hypothetical protein
VLANALHTRLNGQIVRNLSKQQILHLKCQRAELRLSMVKLAQSQADKQRMRLDSDADDLDDSPFAAF